METDSKLIKTTETIRNQTFSKGLKTEIETETQFTNLA